MKRKEYVKRIKKDKWLYIFLLPVVLYFIIFKYIPMIGMMVAFQDYKLALGFFDSPWVGLKHFRNLFADSTFYTIVKNTLVLNTASIVFNFPLPIVFAILLNDIRSTKYKRTVQSVLYIPHFLSWAVLGGIVAGLLSPSSGTVNTIIKFFGKEPIYFMADTFWWRIVYVVSGMWQSVGWGTIVYLAAITGVPQELYEAAEMDGAGKWRRTLHITIPSILPTVTIMLILSLNGLFGGDFEKIYALQNDAVRSVADVIATYEYRNGILNTKYGLTTALGLFKGIISLIIVSTTNSICRKLSDNSLW